MALLKAEQILAAVETLLTGLAATGANVQRGQVYGHEAAKLPAIAVFMGPDIPARELQTGFIDWDFTIEIETTAQVSADYVTQGPLLDQVLNQIRKEVHFAMMAEHTLGLDFVIDITPGPANAPTLSGEGALPTGSQRLEYVIKYRATRFDLSA